MRIPKVDSWRRLVMLASFAVGATTALGEYPSVPVIVTNGTTVVLQNYATLPLSGRGGSIGNFNPPPNLSDQLSRPNFIVSEPLGAPLASSRFFVPDLNRNLYIFNKTNGTFATYLNFQSIFPRFYNAGGFAGGLITLTFHPGYETNGIFYTVHVEQPDGSATPVNNNLPSLNLSGYATTPPFSAPGLITFHNVLVEWRDTNINNATFEGTAREILRTGQNSRIHPMGDLLFNPLAQPGDSDYGNLYVAVGDGAAGEGSSTRATPQRLDALQGKILRITPDINLRPADQLGFNGRYRIPTTGPDPNPFVSLTLPNLKKEIYAYGFRNCHRISWDPVANLILEDDIGLHSYEELNIVHKGGNYGYSEREGTEQLFVPPGFTGDWSDTPFPGSDLLTVTGLVSMVTPIYPVAAYSHLDGDAISSGIVYRGTLMPQLYGKYIFGDVTTARLFYCDLDELIAADDGVRTTLATIHEIQVQFDSPYDAQGLANWRLFDIVAEEYDQRGGNAPGSNVLPGGASVTDGDDPYGEPYGGGRADMRIAEGGDGEIYVISKSDGTIRKMVSAHVPGSSSPPSLSPIPDQQIEEGSTLTFTNSATGTGVLTFSLGGTPPDGAEINPNDGVFSWTPTEAQGPATNSISVVVSDDGIPSLSATQSFIIIVTELNEPPQFDPLPLQTIAEGETLMLTNIAQDADIPANILTFSLGDNAPEAVVLDTNTGVLTWNTMEADGPATNAFDIIVTDNGAPPLSATQSVTVVIEELNSPPQLAPLSDFMVHEGETVTFTAVAMDDDVPTNVLSFALDPGAPAGAGIGAETGEFTWTPGASDIGTSNAISVRVTDDGSPPMDDAQSFSISVFALPVLEAIGVTNGIATIAWNSISNRTYRVLFKESLDDPEWSEVTGDIVADGPTASKTDDSGGATRYYRVICLP